MYHLIQFKEKAVPAGARLTDIQAPPPMKNPPGAPAGGGAAAGGQASAASDRELVKRDT